MEFKKGEIKGVILNKLTKFMDERGFLMEVFRNDELPEGLIPAMSYVSYTEPGVSRGPHEHVEQTDIFAFTGPGNFKLKLWDNRKDSETYGNYMEMCIGEDNPVNIIVPPGVIHGYKNISKTKRAFVINFPDKLFMGKNKKEKIDEIRHENDEKSSFQL